MLLFFSFFSKSLQRKWAQLPLNTKVEVTVPGPGHFDTIESMMLEIDFFNKKK